MANKHLSELEQKYNDLCGVMMANIYTTTKKSKVIPFHGVDINNPEHLFVLSVGIGLSGVVEKRVAVQGSRFIIWRLNRKLGLKSKDAKICRMKADELAHSNAPQKLLDDLRPVAKKMCGPLFTFCDIYHEFYERKKK